MKKEIILTFLYTLPLFSFNCEEYTQEGNINVNNSKTISISSIEEAIQDSIYFKEAKIINLETIDESLLSEIRRIFMDDNKLFIYDGKMNEIFMFDTTGKYINKINRKGEGPGEYVQLSDFTIDPQKKQIVLLCAIPEKQMYFSYDGKLLKEEKNHEFYSRFSLDKNYIYFERTNKNSQIHTLNKETKEKKESMTPINIKNSYYTKGNSFTNCGNILFSRRFDNSIYELSDGLIQKKYDINFKGHSFPKQLIDEADITVIKNECDEHEYIFSMSNVIENNKNILFYTNMGIFIYNKNTDVLKGYKQIQNTKLPIIDYPFIYYIPIENTNKIACSIDEPSFIKHIAEQINNNPNSDKIKEIKSKYPNLIKEITTIGEKIVDENNPLLFIYELKNE